MRYITFTQEPTSPNITQYNKISTSPPAPGALYISCERPHSGNVIARHIWIDAIAESGRQREIDDGESIDVARSARLVTK